jgi:hypothetical protein
MKLACALVVSGAALGVSFGARGQCPVAPAVVRGYFAALERKDFGHALRLTTGGAQVSTARMVGTLERQAAAQHAEVELRVRRLDLQPAGAGPVQVSFDIDIIGRKWLWSRVARTLRGTARFLVRDDGRIAAIEGTLAP